MKKSILIPVLSLALAGGFVFSAAAAVSRPASNVDRMLGKLRSNTNAELAVQDRQRQIQRNTQLREQLSPGNPQNEVQKKNEELKSRLAYLEEKQKAEGSKQ